MNPAAALRRATIRTRLTWTIIAVSLIALLTSGAAVWVLGLRSLRDDVDTRLALTRAELRQMAGSGADPVTGRALTDPAQVVLAHLERSNLPPFDSELGIVDGRARWVSAQGDGASLRSAPEYAAAPGARGHNGRMNPAAALRRATIRT